MNVRALFDSAPLLELSEPPAKVCPYATQFGIHVDRLLMPLANEPTLVEVNQAKILLLDHWSNWRQAVPKAHRGSSSSHRCLFDVFLAGYEKLKLAELTLAPPLLFLPSEPVKPARMRKEKIQPQHIAHLIVGDLMEEDTGDGE